MSTTTVNVDLLRRVLEHITAHPEEWDQKYWATKAPGCGTAYCFAGHTVVMTGHRIDWASALAGVAECVIDGSHDSDLYPSISEVAEKELGLDYEQAERLFYGGNSLTTLWRLASKFTDGAIEVPARFRGGAA